MCSFSFSLYVHCTTDVLMNYLFFPVTVGRFPAEPVLVFVHVLVVTHPGENVMFCCVQLRGEGRHQQPGRYPGPLPHPGGCLLLHPGHRGPRL
jgi:hypothetical protein